MSNVRNLSISLDVAREWYQQGGDLKSIALQVFKEYELHYLPKTWEEFCELTNTPDIQSVGVPTDIIALMKLVKLRDYYCKGWMPEIGESCFHIVNAIYEEDNGECVEVIQYWDTEYYKTEPFMFPESSLVAVFITNFKDLLQLAKRYL